jgi:hypothetical protein
MMVFLVQKKAASKCAHDLRSVKRYVKLEQAHHDKEGPAQRPYGTGLGYALGPDYGETPLKLLLDLGGIIPWLETLVKAHSAVSRSSFGKLP